MLILVLLGAILFYAGLYLLWELSHSRLNTVENWMSALNSMVVMPDHLIFVILRGLILVVTLYVVSDFLLSGARRSKRKRELRRETEQGLHLKWKKPPA